MLTLRHFIDNHTFAAAAGYSFNYFDCMAYTADLYGLILSDMRRVTGEFLNTEIRELPVSLLIMLAIIFCVILWPLIFWIVAIHIWFKCRSIRRRYYLGNSLNTTGKENISRWIRECERKWGK